MAAVIKDRHKHEPWMHRIRSQLHELFLSTPSIRDVNRARRVLLHLIAARVLVLTALLATALWETFSGSATLPSRLSYSLIATIFACSAVNALLLRTTDKLRIKGYLQLVLDVLLCTLVIAVTGSQAMITLYLLVIIGSSVVFSGHGAVLIAGCCAFAYSVIPLGLISTDKAVELNFRPADILAVYFSLTAAALVSSYLARRLEQVGDLAESQAAALNSMTEHQRQVFDDIAEGIITLDLDSAITSINQAARAIIGLTEMEAVGSVGRPLQDVLRSFGIGDARELIQDSSPMEASELVLTSPRTNSELHLRYSSRPLTDSSGKPSGRILVFNDVSHIRDIEEQLRLHERMTELLAATQPQETISSDGANQLHLIGESPVMKQILALSERVAKSEVSVLITGESGAGKEIIAKLIHLRSSRSHKPFVAVNCGAIPENLIESELFGHKKGAFTGAVSDNIGLFRQAQGGTIFLDEIGELPLQLQTKLLRVLQERKVRAVGDVTDIPVDLRVLAATNRDLKVEIAQHRFREDLYYRLNVVNILVPPLRNRREDIPLLVRYFIGRLCDPDTVLPRISPEALNLLMSYPFPGNIRELENVIERALVLGGSAILPDHLPEEIRQRKTAGAGPNAESSNHRSETAILELPIDLEGVLGELERELLTRALEQAGGIKKHAATLLGLNFRSFRYRLKKYELGGTDLDQIDDKS